MISISIHVKRDLRLVKKNRGKEKSAAGAIIHYTFYTLQSQTHFSETFVWTPMTLCVVTGDCTSQKTWNFHRNTVNCQARRSLVFGCMVNPAMLGDKSHWLRGGGIKKCALYLRNEQNPTHRHNVFCYTSAMQCASTVMGYWNCSIVLLIIIVIIVMRI